MNNKQIVEHLIEKDYESAKEAIHEAILSRTLKYLEERKQKIAENILHR